MIIHLDGTAEELLEFVRWTSCLSGWNRKEHAGEKRQKKEVKGMAVEIKGTPKEIAALVLELQGRQEESDMQKIERIVAGMPSVKINT